MGATPSPTRCLRTRVLILLIIPIVFSYALRLHTAHPPLAPRPALAADQPHGLRGAPCFRRPPLRYHLRIVARLWPPKDGGVADAATIKGICIGRGGIFRFDRVGIRTRKRVVVTLPPSRRRHLRIQGLQLVRQLVRPSQLQEQRGVQQGAVQAPEYVGAHYQHLRDVRFVHPLSLVCGDLAEGRTARSSSHPISMLSRALSAGSRTWSGSYV
ncbi:hypothetical protein FIBSPDRAFT_525479 [Athelia psychrophila]|uniref:Uncharacterized protein n=1 Tax=Athelia psychrophila TaxID=1759441 RepID=A0A166JIT0_9AGAM|nr:hypothetical protein FIBSPDRAFT_525479 [Fibularhizoctonia sp. CBS 109695]